MSRKRPCRICRKWFRPDPRVGHGNALAVRQAWHRRICREGLPGALESQTVQDGDQHPCHEGGRIPQGEPDQTIRDRLRIGEFFTREKRQAAMNDQPEVQQSREFR
jgi:hypothetical protein